MLTMVFAAKATASSPRGDLWAAGKVVSWKYFSREFLSPPQKVVKQQHVTGPSVPGFPGRCYNQYNSRVQVKSNHRSCVVDADPQRGYKMFPHFTWFIKSHFNKCKPHWIELKSCFKIEMILPDPLRCIWGLCLQNCPGYIFVFLNKQKWRFSSHVILLFSDLGEVDGRPEQMVPNCFICI